MKRLIIILCLFVFLSCSDDKKSYIADIDLYASSVAENLSKYQVKTAEIMDESAEGGEVIGYFDNDKKVYLEANIYGETGSVKYVYIYKDGSLVYIKNILNKYMYEEAESVSSTEEIYYLLNEAFAAKVDASKNKIYETNEVINSELSLLIDGSARYINKLNSYENNENEDNNIYFEGDIENYNDNAFEDMYHNADYSVIIKNIPDGYIITDSIDEDSSDLVISINNSRNEKVGEVIVKLWNNADSFGIAESDILIDGFPAEKYANIDKDFKKGLTELRFESMEVGVICRAFVIPDLESWFIDNFVLVRG